MGSRGFTGLLNFATRLFDQQMWCWGRDVEWDDNLLLRYGFERWKPPIDAVGTGYALSPDGHRQVVLWGFGLFQGDPEHGGMFVRRYGFHPLLGGSHDLPKSFWRPECVPDFWVAQDQGERERLTALLRVTCEWAADYEAWVRRDAGEDYRAECVAAREKQFLGADRMERAWRRLAWCAEDVIGLAVASDLANFRGFPDDP